MMLLLEKGDNLLQRFSPFATAITLKNIRLRECMQRRNQKKVSSVVLHSILLASECWVGHGV